MNWLLLQCLLKKLDLLPNTFELRLLTSTITKVLSENEERSYLSSFEGHSRISSKLVNHVNGAFFELKCGKDNYSKLTTPEKRSNDFFASCLTASPLSFCFPTISFTKMVLN